MKDTAIASCSGWLLDEGGFSTGYKGGIKTITIISPDNRPFGIHIDSTKFADDADRLFVYDGKDESAPLLTVITNSGGSRGLRTTGSTMTLKFYASGYGKSGKYGWRAKFSCLDDPTPVDFMTINGDNFGGGNMDAADYDNDGDLDILEGGAIYRNDAFQDSLFYFDKNFSPVGAWSRSSFTIADFDNDNDSDIFVIGINWINGINNNLPRLYLNDGTGKFSISSQVFSTAYEGKAKAVDFNNDGKMDISYIGMSSLTSCAFKIYLNNGNGTFTEKSTSVPGLAYSYLDWGDCDNDGDDDLLIHGNNLSVTVTKLFINNSGVLSEQSIGLTGTENGDIRWFDIDKDGKLDIINTGAVTKGNINAVTQVLVNKGNNKFDKFINDLPAWILMRLDFADYDNDNDLDILAAGGVGAPVAAILKNNGNGQFQRIDITNYGTSSIFWHDFNKDGKLDIYTCSNFQKSLIYKNLGNDNFKVSSLPLPIFSQGEGSAAIADIDMDGNEDIIFVGEMRDYDCNNGPNSLIVTKLTWSYFSVPKFTTAINLTLKNNITYGDPFWRWGDFDSDGLLDAIVTNNPGTSMGMQPVIILKNYGKDSFAIAFSEIQAVSQAAAVDLDNDGINELFVSPNIVYKRRNNKFVKYYEDDLGCTFYDKCGSFYVSFADFNSDGFIDAGISKSGYVTIMKNDGTGKLVGVSGAKNNRFFKWIDVDKDGDLDIIGSGLTVENRGNNQFLPKVSSFSAYSEGGIADFNNDSLPDIFAMNSDKAKIYYNQNGSFFFLDKTPVVFPGASNPINKDGALAFDADNDGDNDIIFYGQGCTASGVIINKFNFKYPNLHVRKPTNDEKVTIGSSYQIDWSGKDIGKIVTIYLSVDSGKTYATIAGNISSTSVGGSYIWNTSGLTPARYCFIKVADDKGMVDVNNNSFELKAIVVTATDDNLNDRYKLHIYPNPSNGLITLDLNVKSLKNIVLKVYDNMGVERKVVKVGISNGQDIRTSIDISNLAKGVYYLKLICGQVLPVLKCIKL